MIPVRTKIGDAFFPWINLAVNPFDNPILWTTFTTVVIKTSCNLWLERVTIHMIDDLITTIKIKKYILPI